MSSLWDFEDVLRDLRATALILRHLGGSASVIEPAAVDKLASVLEQDTDRLQALWEAELQAYLRQREPLHICH